MLVWNAGVDFLVYYYLATYLFRCLSCALQIDIYSNLDNSVDLAKSNYTNNNMPGIACAFNISCYGNKVKNNNFEKLNEVINGTEFQVVNDCLESRQHKAATELSSNSEYSKNVFSLTNELSVDFLISLTATETCFQSCTVEQKMCNDEYQKILDSDVTICNLAAKVASGLFLKNSGIIDISLYPIGCAVFGMTSVVNLSFDNDSGGVHKSTRGGCHAKPGKLHFGPHRVCVCDLTNIF